ncbi:MAG: DNA-binding domain-containing protein [Pseudomonadota bacterium]
MTSSLSQLQDDFQRYVLDPQADSTRIGSAIARQFGLKTDDRVAIYYNAYRIRICEALSEAFNKTHSYLGDDLFGEMALAYLQQTPSTTRNLRWYGATFPHHLAQALPEFPLVAELAAFEWALSTAFDAVDEPVLTADAMRNLGELDWDSVIFQLQASVQCLPLRWNTAAVWLALDQDQTPPDAIELDAPVDWLIWRQQLQAHFRSLDSYEAAALRGLQAGKSFAAVCEQAMGDAGEHDIMPKIASWLQTWLKESVLVNPSSTTL